MSFKKRSNTTPKKLVIVGIREDLFQLAAFYHFFETNGWKVEEVESIKEAKLIQGIDILLVYGYLQIFNGPWEDWQGAPKTIWYTFSLRTPVPKGATAVGPGIRPSILYEEVQKVLKKNWVTAKFNG